MLQIMVFIGYVCQMTTAIPTQVKEKKNKDNINPNLSSFLAKEGKEEAVTPLWEVGGSLKACGKEPRPC